MTHSPQAVQTDPMIPAVASGQQIGLLGGPLFILYKILGVYRLSNNSEKTPRTLPDTLNPIFWLEGNDADLDEIRTFHGIDSDFNITTYRWKPQQLRGQPLGQYLVDEDLLTLYQEYFKRLPSTPHSDEIKDLVYSSYRLGKTLLEANLNFFSQLFTGFENSHPEVGHIKWFRPDEEGFRKFSQNILISEIKKTVEGQCPVFALIEGRREALFIKGGDCFTRKGRKIDPEKTILLPSVWNRSILQDAYLRVAAYVAGPAEEKYLKELLPNYERYGVSPARVIPRMSATVIDRKLGVMVEGLGFRVDDLSESTFRDLIFRLQERAPSLKMNLGKLRKKLQKEKDERVAQYSISPTEISRKSFEKKIYLKMKHTLGKKRQDFKYRYRENLTQLQALVNWLHPPNKGGGSLQIPQERFHNLVTFLNFYGMKSIPTLYQKYHFTKKVIELER